LQICAFLNILPQIQTVGKLYLLVCGTFTAGTGASEEDLCTQNVALVPFIALNFNWPTNRGEGVTSGHTKHWQSVITLQMLK